MTEQLNWRTIACLIALIALPAAAGGAVLDPPSRPTVDTPALAALGTHAIGVRTLTLLDREAPDLVTAGQGRAITVDIWYPAVPDVHDRAATYSGTLPTEQPGPPRPFTMPGLAVRGAKPAAGRFPLVIVSHGRSNATAALSWLTENLASKGYVVAAIRHEDLPRNDPREGPEMLLRRPLDIVFVAHSLQQSLAAEGLVDPARTALIGYSMGGYGVLTAGGAMLDPEAGAAKWVPGGLLLPYARGGKQQDALRVANLRAVVAISPWGNPATAWGANGLQQLRAPLLLIAGNRDHTVDYASGARALLDDTTAAPRYLLTFKGAGHALGFGPVPPGMDRTLWDLSWFEDPVWRKPRIIGINLHFITAFLERYVKGDETMAAYLDGLTPESDAGHWQAPPGTAFDAISPGAPETTLWKGFQRDYAEGLELLHRDAAAATQP